MRKSLMMGLFLVFAFYSMAFANDFSASGTYTYDANAGTLSIVVNQSDFPTACNIIRQGEHITFTDVVITNTAVTLRETGDPDTDTWTRSTGSAGDITGVWTVEQQGTTTLVLTINANGNWTLQGTNIPCGDFTASGTYSYDVAIQTFTISCAQSSFPANCDVIQANQTKTFTSVSIADTRMTLIEPDGGSDVWTRTAGTAGDITGTWRAMEDGTSSLDVTFNADGSWTAAGTNLACVDDDGAPPATSSDDDDDSSCFINNLFR